MPKIVWYSPGGQKIDRDFLASTNESNKIYSEIYSIEERILTGIVPSNSHFQSVLHVKKVDRRTAGKYLCKVANIIDQGSKYLKLFYLKKITHLK